MKVLILAAGYGTRLYALVKDKPKALLEVNDKPLIQYILEKIENMQDLNEVILVTNNKFYSIFQEWSKGTSFSCNIRIVNDQTTTPDDRLGSIGDIDYILKQEDVNDDLLVIGSDNLFDFNLDEYTVFAREKSPAVSIGLYDIHNLEEAKLFGVVGLDDNKKITSFEEKPEQPKSTLIAMCFYFLPKESLNLVGNYLQEVKKSDTAGDYIRWLHQKNEVYGFKFSGKWYDIGSVEAYKEAQEKF
jgi:glucose-1-phosphate thymidylyltransferase